MTDPSTLKTIIKRNMELLGKSGLRISVYDVQVAFDRARERKVQETFGSLFNSLSLEELGVASGVIDEMHPPPDEPQSSTAAISPPAPSLAAAKPTTKPAKRK